jgi:hypothetical protein
VSAVHHERERENNGGELRSETAAIATFLLGCCGGAVLPLRTGEELACSGAARWVSGVVRSSLGERTEEWRGVLGFILAGVAHAELGAERKKG